ncbi:hypothetical protein [Actinomadura roseirufa]|uniref:hypothetical protein n=1 Tax=Actinomadura roseirufa TaxID=2094049 RepID=UPI0010411001|nr:hypothetical protein [Actinomadura roseirufa]
MTPGKKAIGARLREVREAPPYWSRPELARLLRGAADPRDRPGLPHVKTLAEMIKHWEAGKWTPNTRYRALYAKATGMSEEVLFGEHPPVPWRAAGLDEALTPDDEERLTLATRRPIRTDLAVIDSLATVLAAQRRLEDAIGSEPLIEPVRAQLGAISGMVANARGPIRTRLLDVAAQWAQFAGWLHTSVERPRQALVFLNRTLAWGTEIDDRQIIGSVMSWQGYIADTRGEIGAMIGLSQAAQRVRRDSVGRVYDLYQEARARALLGETEHVNRLTAMAAQEADEARPDAARPWEYYYFAPGFFGLEHGLTYRILGCSDPAYNGPAIEHLTAGLEGLPADMRKSEWAGDFVYQLARAYEQAGEGQEAARVTAELKEIAAQIGSNRLTRLLAELRH